MTDLPDRGCASQTARLEMALDGDDWSLIDAEPGGDVRAQTLVVIAGEPLGRAISARVPGDVHDDLERAGRLPDLWYSTQSTQAHWVPRRDWWYRKTFTLAEHWRGRRVWLELDGIDYEGEVWLNGAKIGRHEGAFTGARFEVTAHVQLGHANTLAVKIHRAPEAVLEKLFLPRSQENRQEAMDAVTRLLPRWKCRTMTGWDWGTPLWSMGLWRGVRLVGTGDVALRDAVVLPRLDPPYESAELSISTRVHACEASAVALHYRVTCDTAEDGPTLDEQRVALTPGEQDVQHTLRVDQPRLWWPNGYGEQHRYTLHITATDAATGKTLDETSTAFGLRDLKVVPNPTAEDHRRYMDYRANAPDDVWQEHGVTAGEREVPAGHQPNYLMVINGRRIFARGANWLPADLMFGRVNDAKLEHLVRLLALGHYNILRIWGGGLIETPAFYGLCNRYGIMVWQEMPHAGRRPLEDREALAHAEQQQLGVMRSLMNHPSLVRYGFGNELYLDRGDSSQVAQFLDLCTAVDPARSAQGASPVTTDQRHGPHWFNFDEEYGVYNTGYPLSAGPDNPAEWNEYGASGASSVETLERIMPEAGRWPIRDDNADWRWHNGFGAYLGDDWLLPRFYRSLFGDLPDLETEVRVSQWAQAEGLRYANQAHRRAKWHRSGCYHWTFNEPWPNAAHGCVVEYFGQTKMAYHYARSSYASVDVSAAYDGLVVEAGKRLPVRLWLTSDKADNTPGCALAITLTNTRGETIGLENRTLEIDAETSSELRPLTMHVPIEAAGSVLLLDLALRNATGDLLSQQTYTFAVRDPDKTPSLPMRPLLSTPPAALTSEYISLSTDLIHGERVRRHIVALNNPSSVPALFVAVNAGAETQGVYVPDSGMTIMPGQSRRIEVLCYPDAGEPPYSISAKGWNTDLHHVV